MCWCVGQISCPRSYISSKLLQLQKTRYAITSLELISHNKSFLALKASDSDSTRGARLLHSTKVFKDITSGDAIPKSCVMNSGKSSLLQLEIGECIPTFCLVTENV